MEDQRRRTLDALERRFAQAEAEVQSQQQKSKKWPTEDKKKVDLPVKNLSADSSVNTPLPKSSSRKGSFSFQGHTSKEDVGVNEPAYLKLSHSVHENLVPSGVHVSDGKTKVDRVLHELFQHGDSAQKYMKGSKSMKIDNTMLLDNYVQKSGSSNAGRIRALQQSSKRSKKHMSLKQHKRIGLYDLPKEFHNFDLFKPMHEKWKSYVQQLLKIVGKEKLAQCFLTADLHGAIILVVQCKIAAHVGIHGIMVRETKETFGIVTEENKFKVVPKKLSVFALQADCWKITLHGDKLVSRNLAP
ncbi:ribonuclease P family protein [Perilla frutescens var. frutescens]|nr:ribonuclease P family protein [Perilla frutescens var. frutescens]